MEQLLIQNGHFLGFFITFAINYLIITKLSTMVGKSGRKNAITVKFPFCLDCGYFTVTLEQKNKTEE